MKYEWCVMNRDWSVVSSGNFTVYIYFYYLSFKDSPTKQSKFYRVNVNCINKLESVFVYILCTSSTSTCHMSSDGQLQLTTTAQLQATTGPPPRMIGINIVVIAIFICSKFIAERTW
jgi:hypothetical protein